MKVKSNYTLIPNGEEFTLCHNSNPIKPLHLSKIGAFLMKEACKREISNTEMLELLLQSFEISTVLALGEIDTFIKIMKENGIFEE